jgi:hypothetical protein
VLVLVRTAYFISPVPALYGEHSPIRHQGRAPVGRLASPHRYMFRLPKLFDIVKICIPQIQVLIFKSNVFLCADSLQIF